MKNLANKRNPSEFKIVNRTNETVRVIQESLEQNNGPYLALGGLDYRV